MTNQIRYWYKNIPQFSSTSVIKTSNGYQYNGKTYRSFMELQLDLENLDLYPPTFVKLTKNINNGTNEYCTNNPVL